ncbi:pentraxin-related protein PTX3 [Megalops cyprinoides]|uniref:pentraxin-related protein PTX3 n=1 Tax=Megalops cyprinoides TaxID=118141 RepID=UPI001863A7D2|nr:pentraxin-related protein PTX3 [Megalops cyprinoides]
MPLLRVLLVCVICSTCLQLTQAYEEEIEVNYADPFYNEIAEGEQQETDQPESNQQDVGPTLSPCKTPEFTKWDKLFTMLENSQMKENMLLQYADDIIKVELQSLRGEMLQFVANYAGGCASAVDNAGRRLAVQMDMKLAQAFERQREASVEQRTHQDAMMQQLLAASRNQAARLGKLESSCLSGSATKGFTSTGAVQEVTKAEGSQLEKSLAAMAADLQKARVQLDLSLRSAAQHFLPAGCEMALLFPMRSRRIFAAVTPDAPLGLRTFTVCLWAKVREALNKTVLFSYGTKKNPFEIQLVLSGQSALFTVGGEAHLVEASDVVQDGKWSHFCGTWSSEEGLAALWVNGQKVASSPGVAEGHTLPDGGTMQLGQEKNGCCSFGFDGGFDAKLAFAGKMTGVNVWDRVLGPEEISQNAQQEGSCGSRGNVVGWGVSEIIPHGGAQYIN